MANIALIGASGNAGSRILKELSDRGHPQHVKQRFTVGY
ncbi:putative NADH-flavin reductase [Rhizobium sp. BK538]|nr:putative NADH-flavin reductase [Rhizobium sp. BK060]MBB4168921.1 putative NADH-flavin reductase [Rhizobium sp. BK538]